jgi:phosphatidylglycerophosphate synthase
MKKFSHSGAMIGLIVGIIGTIFAILTTELSGPIINLPNELTWIGFLLIPFYIVSIILSFSGIFGCNFKVDGCFSEAGIGFALTPLIFLAIGYFIGFLIDSFLKE